MTMWQRVAASLLVGVVPSTTLVGCSSGSNDVIDSGAPDQGAPIEVEAGTDEGSDAAPPVDPFAALPPDDTSAFTGLGSDGGPCRPAFASGANVAWVQFASDIPNPRLSVFQTIFQNTHARGGRVMRWWLHTDGRKTPGYDATTGFALPISASDIADIKSVVDTARGAGMLLTISLWSFDMLKSGPIAYNTALLTKDANRQAYIDNVLTPLVTALKGYPGIYSWETFNEPEGMTTNFGWLANKIDESNIQRTVNWFASAIHDADPSAFVTNGTWQFRANANAAGMTNAYSDVALQSAGGKANGTLDYYEVHYYMSNGSKVSPFANAASFWALDKPIVIGEFYALAQDGVAAADTFTSLYTRGYRGAWAWQYQNSDGSNSSNLGQTTTWPAIWAPMQNLYTQAPNDLDCP